MASPWPRRASFLGHARVRRATAVALLAALAVWIVFSPVIVSWLTLGSRQEDLAQLTGRTRVWAAAAGARAQHHARAVWNRPGEQVVQWLPIDSNWVATHLETGRLGVAIVVAVLLVLFFAAVTRPAGPRRAVALFLIVFCLTSSFTETGLGDASPYLLELTVAALLLASPPRFGRRRLVAEQPVQATRNGLSHRFGVPR